MPIHRPKMKLSKDMEFQEKLGIATNLATILAHPLRLSLLEFVDQFSALDEQKLNLVFQGDQSVLRTHLDMLISAQFIISTKNKHRKFLTVNYEQIEKVQFLLHLFMTEPQQLEQFKSARQHRKKEPQKTYTFDVWKKSLSTIRKKLNP